VPSRGLASQRGLSLIETVVALGLFALTAATMGNYLVSQVRRSSSNYLYTQAYALAQDQLESTRALRYNDMVPGSTTSSIGGTSFTVQTQIQNDTPADGLKQITVNVSWKDMQGPQNVAVQTIYTEVQQY
jgi:type II secretory pathway pseudopilin PulG